MGISSAELSATPSSCVCCGAELDPKQKFCGKCGEVAPPQASSGSQLATLDASKKVEFERHLRVAWSCVTEVEGKIDEIRSAKQASDNEIEDGSFRGMIAAEALHGRLNSQFQEGLDLALRSAASAQAIDPNGFISVDGVDIEPNGIRMVAWSLRGDLQLALEQWDPAISCYSEALKLKPNNPPLLYSIGVAYTNKHEPDPAIEAFQKVIALEPVSPVGIEASKLVDKLRRGVLGKKSFTGSWILLLFFGFMTFCSFVVLFLNPQPGLISLIFWGGIAFFYYKRKFK